ncbi:MAG: 4a-hydroxytetrahydrobiopterin dehydratase [Acidobacteria bacterium]|nr:4a-hydroxytetrahydrobiopterin dehydratase [Acidobacteriota bacterium]
MSDLTEKQCQPCEGGVVPLPAPAVASLMKQLDGWIVVAGGGEIRRSFVFRNYHETMAFVNAIARIAHQENHHPDLEVAYDRCMVRFTTHAISGLSENDFICAAKVDQIPRPS